MAFALTKFRAYPLALSSPSKTRAVQCAVLHIAATTADVALDIGNPAGTFWTEALGNGTYGGLASQVLPILQRIAGQAEGILAVDSPQLLPRLKAAAASGTSYTLAVQNVLPNITCAASNGEASWIIYLQWQLKDDQPGVSENYG